MLLNADEAVDVFMKLLRTVIRNCTYTQTLLLLLLVVVSLLLFMDHGEGWVVGLFCITL